MPNTSLFQKLRSLLLLVLFCSGQSHGLALGLALVGISSKGTTLGEDVAFTTRDTYAAWKTRWFGNDSANPAVSGDALDADHDGLNTAAEYAFGTNPNTPDTATFLPTNEQGFLCITYRRPAGLTGVSYTAEVASSLAGPWLSGGEYTQTAVANCPGGCEEVKVRSLVPLAAASRQFLRIHVEQTPP